MATTRTNKTTSTGRRRSSKSKPTDDAADKAESVADGKQAPDPPWSDAKEESNGTKPEDDTVEGGEAEDTVESEDTADADDEAEDTTAEDDSDDDDSTESEDDSDPDVIVLADDDLVGTSGTESTAGKSGRFRRKTKPQPTPEVVETPEQAEERVVAHLDLLAHERRRPAATPVAQENNGGTTTTVQSEPSPAQTKSSVVEEPRYEPPQPTVVATQPAEPAGWPELKLRRLVAAGLIIAIAVSIGYVMGGRVPPTYRAEAEVLYTSDETLSEGQAELRLATQVALAQSTAIMRPVAAAEGLKVAQLRDQVIVGVAGDSEILLFAVENEDEVAALRILESVVNGYLIVANAPSPTDTTEYLQVRIAELEAERDALATRLSDTPEASRAEVEAELASVQAVLSSMEGLLTETELENIGADSASLLSPSQLLPDPVGSPQLMSAAVGALAGIAVAGMVLFILRQRDQQEHRSQ
ncbi:MAG: hypothetical protein ACR2PK_11840 [Acidimicrobiales bacterium]